MIRIRKWLKKIEHDNLCFVIGLNNTTGLSIVRDLGIHKVRILGFDQKSISIGRYSKYCDNFLKYEDDDHLLEILVYIGKQLNGKVPILVSSDKLAIFVEKNEKTLSQFFLFYWQKKIKLADIIDKTKMFKYAAAAGLDVPLTFFSSKTPLEVIEKNIVFPSVIKPTHTKGKIKAILLDSKKEFKGAIKDQMFEDGYIVQKLVQGPENNIFLSGTFSDKKGNLIASACGVKQRQLPKDMGIATSAISVENNVIRELSEIFTKYIEYYGPADIEFKKSSFDGKYMFIEVNPRFPGFNQLFASSDCHLAYISYLSLKGKLDRKTKYLQTKDGTKYISMINDLVTVIKSYKNVTILNWLKDIATYNSYAVFSSRDPIPFFIDIANRTVGLIFKLLDLKRSH